MTHVCCSNSNSFKNLVEALNYLTKLSCDFGIVVMHMGLQFVSVLLGLRDVTYCLSDDRHSMSELS